MSTEAKQTHKQLLIQTFETLGVQMRQSDNAKEQEEAPPEAKSYVSVLMANYYFDENEVYLGIECANVKGDYKPAVRK